MNSRKIIYKFYGEMTVNNLRYGNKQPKLQRIAY